MITKKVQNFTVTFDVDGETTTETVAEGATVAEPVAPAKDGYTFDGWYLDGVKYDFATAVTGDITLVAQFTENVVEPEPIPYGFESKMNAFLELENEILLGVGFNMNSGKEGDKLTKAEVTPLLENVGLLIWNADEVPAEAEATIENCDYVVTGGVYENSRIEVTSEGIPAKKLGDQLAFRPFYTDGNGQYKYGRLIASYSPKTYCYNKLKTSDPDLRNDPVCIAILNYGAAAQKHFKHNVDNLMNADLTAEQQALVWDGSLVRKDWDVPGAKEAGLERNTTVIKGRGGNIVLGGAIDVTYYFRVNTEVAEAVLLTWSEADYNAVEVLSEANATAVVDLKYVGEDKGYPRYEYLHEGVAVKNMFNTLYVCAKITGTDGNVYYSGVIGYSAERFAFINQNNATETIAEVAKRIAIYGDAARTYFYKLDL